MHLVGIIVRDSENSTRDRPCALSKANFEAQSSAGMRNPLCREGENGKMKNE